MVGADYILANNSRGEEATTLKWSSVTLSSIVESDKRLDAQKYDIALRATKEVIFNNPNGISYIIDKKDGKYGLCEAYRPGICKRIFVEKTDDSIPMLTPSQITDTQPKAEKFLAKSFCEKISDWFVKENEILLTCSGTIGNVSLVSRTLHNCCISQNLIRIVAKRPKDTGYIYTYLKSQYGQCFLMHNNYGAVIQHIDPEHLASVPIPNASKEIKERIHDLIVRSYDLRDESNELIDQATKLLIDELHLPDIRDFEVNDYKKNAPVETFSVKLSDMAGRADASYHLPIVDAITKHLQEYADEVANVGDSRISTSVILPPRFARVYVEEGYGRVLIGGKQIYELDPSGKKYLSNTKHKKLLDQLEVTPNTILITRSGTVGKVAFVPRHWSHYIPSDHIIRVVPKDEGIAGYLYIFLCSQYGAQLINRFVYGSVVDEIDDNQVGQIAIPLLKNKDVQKQINDLALLANEKRYEAYQLEQQALQIMNEEVIYAK